MFYHLLGNDTHFYQTGLFLIKKNVSAKNLELSKHYLSIVDFKLSRRISAIALRTVVCVCKRPNLF